MKTRGKILREPNERPGLVMIEGQQFQFSREAGWKSQMRPTPGMLVDVDLDRDLQVIGLTAVMEPQPPVGDEARGPSLRRASAEGIFRRLRDRLSGRSQT